MRRILTVVVAGFLGISPVVAHAQAASGGGAGAASAASAAVGGISAGSLSAGGAAAAAGAAAANADASDALAQVPDQGPGGGFFSNPLLVAGIITAAIAIPVAVALSNNDTDATTSP